MASVPPKMAIFTIIATSKNIHTSGVRVLGVPQASWAHLSSLLQAGQRATSSRAATGMLGHAAADVSAIFSMPSYHDIWQRRSGRLRGAFMCVRPPGFPVPQIHCHPTHAAPRQPLTVPVGLPPPAARWRWQLKISSARLRYCVIFRFTASRRSLLGSTAGSTEGGYKDTACCAPQRDAPVPWPQSPEGCPGPLAGFRRWMLWYPGHAPQMDAPVPWPCSPTGCPSPLTVFPGGMLCFPGHASWMDAPFPWPCFLEGCPGPLAALPRGTPWPLHWFPRRDVLLP